ELEGTCRLEYFYPGDAEGGVAHPHRGLSGTRVDVRDRRAQRGLPPVCLRGGGTPGVRLQRPSILSGPVLRGYAGASERARLLRFDLGLPAKSRGSERASRRDLLRSSGACRQRGAVRVGGHRHTPRPRRRRGAAGHLFGV
ncbi:MAG: Adenosine deaminase, partial [uncultured Rubrobacteraceae bacterium]